VAKTCSTAGLSVARDVGFVRGEAEVLAAGEVTSGDLGEGTWCGTEAVAAASEEVVRGGGSVAERRVRRGCCGGGK
jgi:hypothetical protein